MQQQPGGSQFGVPPQSASDMPAFPSSSSGRVLGIQEQAPPPPPEAASPISSRPPASFDDLGPAMAGNFGEDEALAAAGEEGERGATPGNRWPRQETLALLKIRSDMDAAFRDATLKGPLWDEVSRKLAELGYKRNAKKCKEKFENVHKYYKRTKEGRAGRQDGKSYRFFTELEALHTGAGGSSSSPAIAPKIASTPTTTIAASQSAMSFSTPAMVGPSSVRTIQASPISAAVPQQLFSPQPIRPVTELTPPIITTTATTTNTTPMGLQGFSAAAVAAGISFSSNSSASDSFESDDEGTEDATEASGQRSKRPHEGSHLGSRKKMMVFFEGLMKQVVEKQEAMQQKFLETIEKREQERMIREEAWRRQEVARLSREQELLAQERAMAANRDAALISYLQKLSGSQPIPVPTTTPTIPTNPVVVTTSAAPPAPPPPPSQPQMPSAAVTVQPLQQQTPPPPPPQPIVTQHQQPQHDSEQLQLQISPTSEHMSLSELHEGAASNRWPKAEVHALIKIRSGLEIRYQEAGPKGPLWEEISVEMQKLGYNRNSKRCKEKWENINKYYKKVKESNKKRPEDAKTCPYFHALDALHRQKQLNAGSTSASSSSPVGISSVQERAEPLSVKAPLALPSQMAPVEGQIKNGNDGKTNGGNSQGVHVQTSNGGLTPSFFEEGMKKPEDIMMELMKQRQQQSMIESYDNDGDSDTMDQDEDDDDDEDDDENRKLQYKIQFQRQNVGTNGGEGGNASTTNSAAMNAGSFLAIVQ